MSTRRISGVASALVLVASFLVVSAGPARAAVITVNTTEDAYTTNGNCSLREAIVVANVSGGGVDQCEAGGLVDTIAFSIPGAGPHTISLTSALPAVQTDILIDGTTQPNYNGTPLIELNGAGAGVNVNGIWILGNNSTVRGLTINRFDGAGVFFEGNNNSVDSSYIGTDNTGTQDQGNGDYGVLITGDNNKVGNPDASLGPQYRNVISGNGSTSGAGIYASNASSGNVIYRNYIGTNAAGTGALGNPTGIILFASSNNVVGNAAINLRNLISANSSHGVSIVQSNNPATAGSGNVILGNYIGTDVTGSSDLGNGTSGVSISAHNNVVGGFSPSEGNLIAFNGNPQFAGNGGVVVPVGTNNSIIGNSIHSNEGMGIDLNFDRVTPNDDNDADVGPNDLQNFPELSSISASGGDTFVGGSLHSTPNSEFYVEFFRTPTCKTDGFGNRGEGKTVVDATTLTTDGDGNAEIAQDIPVEIPPGHFVTTTATEIVQESPDSTSEFSACVRVPVVDMRVIKKAPETVRVGRELTYSITLANKGTDPAFFVHLDDRLPRGVKLLNITQPGEGEDNCFAEDRDLGCNFGAIGAGESLAIEVTVRVLEPGSLKNTATVSTASTESRTSNNSDSATTQANCDVTGTADPDVLEGTRASETICGLGGGDEIQGRGGRDFIVGGSGGDTVDGGGGNDTVYGNDGDDDLSGGDGDDELVGGDGDDDMSGGPGDDTCRQGPGSGMRSSCENP